MPVLQPLADCSTEMRFVLKPCINIPALLEPIKNSEGGTGRAFALLSDFASFTSARNTELQVEAGTHPDGPREPRWTPILKEALKLLTTKSKDLQLALWIVELLLRQNGYKGLQDGLQLIIDLQTHFGADLHPKPDVDDPEDPYFTRIGILNSLTNKVLLYQLSIAPLTSSPSQPTNLGLQQLSQLQSSLKQEPEHRTQIINAIADTPQSHFTNMLGQLQACLILLSKLDERCQAQYGKDEVDLYALKTPIEAAITWLKTKAIRTPQAVDSSSKTDKIEKTQKILSDSSPTSEVTNISANQSAPNDSERLLNAAYELKQMGDIEGGLQIIQKGINQSLSGRSRFLCRLVLAEFCLCADLMDLARPIVEALTSVSEQQNILQWESSEVCARLCDLQFSINKAPTNQTKPTGSNKIYDQLCRVDINRAYHHYKTQLKEL